MFWVQGWMPFLLLTSLSFFFWYVTFIALILMLVLCFCLYNRLSSSDMYAIYSYAKCTFCCCSSSPTLSLPLLLVVCTLSIQPNYSPSKYISRASPARGDTFVSISFHRLICYKITFSCLINFYALKHTHSYTHFLSRSHTHAHRRLQQAFTCVDIAFCIRGIFSLSSPICEICAPGAIFP